MATPQRLTSQVSTDAAPMTPRPFVGESINFPDKSDDAGPNQQQQIQKPAMVQQRQSNAGQERPADLQLHHDKLTPSLGDLEKLEMNAREKIKGLTSTNDQDEDSSYSSIVSSASISNMTSIGLEEELRIYGHQMPPEIKTDHFDCLILYAEEDRIAAFTFQNHLINEIDIGKNDRVTAMLFDCPELIPLSGSVIGHLEEAFEKSTYVFVYLTEHFVKDIWMKTSSESCLMKSIYDNEKKWCVIPVYTQRRETCTFKIPMVLNALKGINYYNNDEEFYRQGVAKLIIDKVQQRKDKNEKLKMRKKAWLLEEHKRQQLELQEKQKGIAEEQKTACMKDEPEKCNQNRMIHTNSESQLSAPCHSLPHISSADSLKDIHSQNRYSTYVQGDIAASTVHNPVVIFPLQTHQGIENTAIENTAIPRSLSDNRVSYSDGLKQEFGKENEKLNPLIQNPPDVSQYHQIQTKEQLLQSNSQQMVSAETMHASVQEHDGPLSNTPPSSTSLHDDVDQSNMAQAQVMPGSPWTTQGQTGNQHDPFLGHSGNQRNMVPVQGLPGNQPYYSTHMHGDSGNQGIPPQNQPNFSELLSYNSSNQSSNPYNSGGYNSEGMTAICNQPEGNMLVQDCGSLQSNTASANTTARAPTAYQEKHMEDKEEDREVTKGKKLTSSETENHVHFTINVYNADAVQVGNQNMVQTSTGVEPNSDDASDDERESFPESVIETGRREQESMEPSHSTHVLQKDPAEGDGDDQGTRAETANQQQPIQGSCNMDAALSSVGSQPSFNYQMEHPFQHGTEQKTIVEEASDDQVTNIHTYSETNNQLPEGMEKLLCSESNLEASTSVEKSSFKDKVTTKETNEIETNEGRDLRRLDLKFKMEKNPAVAKISPMNPKIPSESGEEVVQSFQTKVKSVVTESNESRAINFLGTQPQTAKENVQLLRPSGIDALSSPSNQGGPSDGFTPAAEPLCGARTGDCDIDYNMCDSDRYEGTVSTSRGRSTSRPKGNPKTKGVSLLILDWLKFIRDINFNYI